MTDRLSHPDSPPARFWIVLPAAILILADGMLTFLFQPTSYWADGYANRIERSPLGAAILGSHPALFAGFILIWILLVVLLVARLHPSGTRLWPWPSLWDTRPASTGGLVERNYWYTIPTFILVGVLTVACWQKAEAARPP